MAIFKGQGKSGVTGPKVQKTIRKTATFDSPNKSLHNYSHTPKGGKASHSGELSVRMVGKPNPAYSPTSVTLPEPPVKG